MKTKQSHIKAVFSKSVSNAKNYSNEKELISLYKIIDKKTETCVIDCRVYSGRSRSSSTLYASIWVKTGAKCKQLPYDFTSGTSSAGGWGYDKESSAIAGAIADAEIELFGTAYPRSSYSQEDKKIDFKKRVYIGGTGCHEEALLAIAYAAGYSDCILAKY